MNDADMVSNKQVQQWGLDFANYWVSSTENDNSGCLSTSNIC